MGKVMIFDHPLIRHKIGIIRDENTNQKVIQRTGQ
jgi:uracil phosphoribosyltransferase